MIAAEIVGADRVLGWLQAMPDKGLEAIKADVERLAILLLRKVKEEKLSGQVLKNQTGTLRRSINKRVDVQGHGLITGSVGTNLSYAAAHEFGCDKTVNVRAHLRMVKVAWGRTVKNPMQHMVGSHTMKMNLPERSFLRSALEEMTPEIRESLAAAISKAVGK